MCILHSRLLWGSQSSWSSRPWGSLAATFQAEEGWAGGCCSHGPLEIKGLGWDLTASGLCCGLGGCFPFPQKGRQCAHPLTLRLGLRVTCDFQAMKTHHNRFPHGGAAGSHSTQYLAQGQKCQTTGRGNVLCTVWQCTAEQRRLPLLQQKKFLTISFPTMKIYFLWWQGPQAYTVALTSCPTAMICGQKGVTLTSTHGPGPAP